MILVIVGSHPQGFERLINEVDRLAKRKIICDVFMQIGCSEYIPKYVSYKRYLGYKELHELIRKCDFVISHAGAGITMEVLEAKKKLILVPRYKRFFEHSNNHQLDITNALEKEKAVLSVYNIKDLEGAIKRLNEFSPMV